MFCFQNKQLSNINSVLTGDRLSCLPMWSGAAKAASNACLIRNKAFLHPKSSIKHRTWYVNWLRYRSFHLLELKLSIVTSCLIKFRREHRSRGTSWSQLQKCCVIGRFGFGVNASRIYNVPAQLNLRVCVSYGCKVQSKQKLDCKWR